MFVIDRKYKLALFFVSSLCFTGVIIENVPFGNNRFILPICFFISEIPRLIQLFAKNLKKNVVVLVEIISLLGFFVLLINSPHFNNSFTSMLRMAIFEIISKYFALVYSFICISKFQDIKPSINFSFYAILVLSFFAILNFLTKHAFYIDAIGIGQDVSGNYSELGGMFENQDRFRVQSMFFNPFDYGFICVLMFIFHGWAYLNYLENKNRFVIISICCLIGIVSCGCRTNLVCFLISILPYIVMRYQLRTQFKLVILFGVCSLLLYFSIPVFHDLGNSIISMFEMNSDVDGSSIEMRLLQYATVFYYVQGHWLTGNGYGYFNIDMGWSDGGRETLLDQDLFGLEGVLMNHLLERGIIGIAFYFLFYAILFYYFYKNKAVDLLTSCLGLSVLLVYLSFANITGDLLSVFPSLLVIGFCVKIIYLKKNISYIYEKEQ